MRPIFNSRLFLHEGRIDALCLCGKRSSFAFKSSALRMINRGVCRYCRPDYRSVNDAGYKIHQNSDGRWCSLCSGCGKEQIYTRKNHAKQSSLQDRQCKKCVAASKGFSENRPVGDERRIYNKFCNSAKSRGLAWEISFDDLFSIYDGTCAMTKWKISISYGNQTASIDRIDNNLGYIPGNIQWVHVMVNMTRGKYSVPDFVAMCQAVASGASGKPAG